MKDMHWFRYDLRLHDNASLSRLARNCDELLLVYVIDPSWFQQTELESCSMGAPRQQFLSESLIELQRSLGRFGQRLLILQGRKIYQQVRRILTDVRIVQLTAHLCTVH